MSEIVAFSSHAARVFAEKYAEATSEKQLAQSFWRDFFSDVAGIADLMSTGIEFEFPVRSHATNTTNFIDVLWSGVVLIEHKSAGRDLDAAERQGRDYIVSLTAEKRPPVLVVSDFKRVRIIDIITAESHEFALNELPANVDRFERIIGKHAQAASRAETVADAKAVDVMAALFNAFESAGYSGHEVSVFLIRLLFVNFGDDTGMWKRRGHGLFAELVAESRADGRGLGGEIQEVFEVMNTSEENRASSVADALRDFPYVNGGLFAERLPVFSFTQEMRDALIATTHYDWSKISPAIFGAMFQTVKSKTDRREGGEHYTSESNILKVIRPLFLDEYNERLRKGWNSATELRKLRADLGRARYIDAAAGSGNFLIVAYQRLREIELKIIVRLQELGAMGTLTFEGMGNTGLSVRLSQFHAIEIEEWSSQIATVAMYLADHQANLALEEITGASHNRFPLRESANIVHGNALQIDWTEVCEFDEHTIVMGNPPFYGARFQTPEQKADTVAVWNGVKGVGELDFVASWFLIAARHISKTSGRAALVATNSITQGEQPAIIWGQISLLNVGIDFAHRTFRWDNEASGKAAVHCVIVGFSANRKQAKRRLWSYANPTVEPELTLASNINGYLLDAPNVLITSRSTPLVLSAQRMDFGSMPNDGGVLSNISVEEAEQIRQDDPVAAKYLRRLVGSQELINSQERFCLWLKDANPSDIRSSPLLTTKIRTVRDQRLASKRAATQKLASRASEFAEIRQPTSEYIAVPKVSSSAREYLPIAILPPDVIASDLLLLIPHAKLATFGLLSSRVFDVWNRAISGRLKSDFRIGVSTTYNNFPFPELTDQRRSSIVDAAQRVLDARESFPDASLADLYDRDAMPSLLRLAHQKLDKVTLAAFGLKSDATDERILAKLFATYDELTRGLLESTKRRAPSRS